MREESNAVSAAKGSSFLWLQNILSSIARIVAFAFFARLISVDEMGVYTILSLAYNAASILMGLGLSSLVTKFVAENIAQGKKEEAASVYYKSLLLSELASVLLAAGFLTSRFPVGVSNLPNSPLISAISVFFVIDVVANVGPTAAAAFNGLLEFRSYALIYGIYASLRPFVIVLLVYETGSLVGLVEAWVISDAILAIYVFAYLWRRLGPPVFRFSAKHLLTLASPLYVANVASFLYDYSDQLILIPLVSLSALGVYGAAITAFNAYETLIGVPFTVLLPIFSKVFGVKGREALEDSIRTASRYLSIVAIPLAFALLATAKPVLTLFLGTSYEGGSVPLAVLALASVASVVGLSLGPVLFVLNETRLEALTTILPIPACVAVALISIPTLGILGASIARGLSMLLNLLLTWYCVQRKVNVKLDSQAILKSLAASGTMALIIQALQIFYYNPLLLPVYLLAGFLIYLLALRTMKTVNTADIHLLRNALGPRSSRICDLLTQIVVD